MTDILRELGNKIDRLDRNINDLRSQLNKENMELNQISSQISELKTIYEMKRMKVSQMSKRLEEKTRIVTEARNAYNKIIHNTTKLIEAVNTESYNDI